MNDPIDEAVRRQARVPHEVLMVNLALSHLLLAPAAIALNIGAWGLLLTPLCSAVFLAYIYLRGLKAEKTGPWFVMAHWKLAWQRCRLLLFGYAASALVIGGGALLALGASSHSMRDIIFTIATRIGVMPTVIMVLVSFVLANSALELANQGEVPEVIKKKLALPTNTQ